MRPLYELFIPGGVVLLAALLLLRPGVLPDSALPFLRSYPYAVIGIGLPLAWYVNRTRVVFALVVLALADRGLAYAAVGPAMRVETGRIVFNAVSLLLPANLAAYSLIAERGLFTPRGMTRLAPIVIQAALVGLLCLPSQRELAAVLEYGFVDVNLGAWTSIPQPGLAAFGAAAVLLVVRYFLQRNAIEGGFVWALAAAFAALQGSRAGWIPTNSFATAGLALVVALIEMSYRMAYYDELTGLPGRRALNEALLRISGRYAVAMVDIDHFKIFNDRYGHDVGDQMLRMVASKLEHVSGGGTAFRYGGEEFAVVFPGQSATDVVPHVESLRRAVQAACFVIRGPDRPRKKPDTPRVARGPRRAVLVTVSIGLGERDDERDRPDHVIKAADKALHRAKNAGRNRVST